MCSKYANNNAVNRGTYPGKEVMHMGGASIANPADYMANNDHELVVLDLKP